MKNRLSVFQMFSRRNQALLAVACGLAAATSSFATVLDDFNAAQRSGWQDADPGNFGLPGGQQANGVFTFGLPAVGQDFFVSSTKTSRTFELKEGRTIEFRVDMVSGQGVDSYAVMGFIPTGGANSLAGYGLAKSESDVLITKGINKYFIDDDTTPVKNHNITLTLNLTVKGGSVYIRGQVLDKNANNSVIWERSFVDTSAADIMGTGLDDPPAPYITTGNFVLYLYGQNGTDPAGYQVVYDNAEYFESDAMVLDDFNAEARSGWEDSDPAGLSLPGGQQANGVFTFQLPALGQDLFVESIKTSKTFSLDEGTLHEFSVDLVGGKGPDSYAVLAFIPNIPGAGPNSLTGYGIAKSESDTLISKGINKYFIDDDTTVVKNENVTLVLTLTVVHTNVIIRGKVLDKDNSKQVIWDRTYVDTQAADILGTGTDSPPQPFIGLSGNVVLYLYAQNGTDPTGYQVVYDNLVAVAPAGATNLLPIISNVSPKDGAAFLPAPVPISFVAADDKPLPDTGISVRLGGTIFTSSNGLVLSGATTNRAVTLNSGTVQNTNYVGEIVVTDSDGSSTTNLLYLDTFTATDRIVEIEDHNFGGQYYNNPVPAPEGGQADNSYVEQVGIEGVDFHDTRTTPNGADTMYRSQDPVRMQHSLDQARSKYDPASGIYGYDVGDIAADEWLNYTKDFDAGNYEVYLRESVVNFPQADSTLELVTGDASQPNQSVATLGTFLGKLSGFTFRNVPLTDGSGLNKVVIPLSGKATLRLRHLTADTSSSARYMNYLVFVPVAAVTIQRPTVSSLQPAPNSTVNTVSPTIVAEILNRATSVNTNSIKLEVNGLVVSPTIAGTAGGASVTWPMTPLPASGAVNSATLTFKDSDGVESVTPWSFTVTYNSIDPAWRVQGTGKDRGINARVIQAQLGQNTDNSLTFAEELLRPGQTTYLVQYDTNVVVPVINFSQNGPGTTDGSFPDDELIPGLDPNYSTDDIAAELTAYLDLPAGKHRLGVNSDDGYKVQAVPSFTARDTAPIAYRNGGANETYDFVVSQAGLYPFRMVWYERGGGAHVEWFQSNFTDGTRVLLNSEAAGTLKAFATVNVSTPAVFDAPILKDGQLTIKWTGTGVLQESSDLKTWTDVPGQPTSPYTTTVGAAPGGKYYSIRQ